MEHILLGGTKNFPSSEKISEFTKENGIYYNAYTSGEKINLSLNTPDINLNKALKILDEIIFQPILHQERINNELKIINQEYLSKWDYPENRFQKKINQHLFGQNHIYHRDGLGQIDFIKKISSSDLKEIHQKYFQPQNMVITFVGNLGKPSKLIQKLNNILTKYPNTFKSKIKYPLITPSNRKTLIYQDNPEQETIFFNWILEKDKKDNRLQKISNTLFSHILGKTTDSLLFKIFRLKYGLVYSIKSFCEYLPNCSFFVISCQINPSSREKFLDIFQKELNNILNQIDQKTFNRTIKFLNYQELMTYDSIAEISNMVKNEAFNYKTIFLPEDYIDLSRRINFSKTLKYFKEKITWSNKYLFTMTSSKSKK